MSPTPRSALARGFLFFFFSSRRRHTRCSRDWSSDVCSSDLPWQGAEPQVHQHDHAERPEPARGEPGEIVPRDVLHQDRKSTRLNSSHGYISYAVFCLKKKKKRSGGRAAKNHTASQSALATRPQLPQP